MTTSFITTRALSAHYAETAGRNIVSSRRGKFGVSEWFRVVRVVPAGYLGESAIVRVFVELV